MFIDSVGLFVGDDNVDDGHRGHHINVDERR